MHSLIKLLVMVLQFLIHFSCMVVQNLVCLQSFTMLLMEWVRTCFCFHSQQQLKWNSKFWKTSWDKWARGEKMTWKSLWFIFPSLNLLSGLLTYLVVCNVHEAERESVCWWRYCFTLLTPYLHSTVRVIKTPCSNTLIW